MTAASRTAGLRPGRLRTVWLLTACLAAAPVLAQKATFADLPGLDGRWLEATADEFTVWSSDSKHRVAQVVEQLEAFRTVLRLFFPALEQAPRRETYVYYFDSARQFLVYGSEDARVAGFFMAMPEANYIAVDGSAGNPYATVFHEYVHYILRNNVPDLPLWLNEGLAEYFETFQVVRGNAEFGGERSWIHYLNTHDWTDYRDIVVAGIDSDLYQDPARSGAFRAQAWALTHLLYDPENRDSLIRFMGALSGGEPSDRALAHGFQAPLSELETIVRNHVRSARFSSRLVDLDTIGVDPAPELRELGQVETFTNLARLLASVPSAERAGPAQVLLDRALEEAPEHVPALVGKAALLLRREERLEEARTLLDQAIALDPSDATAHYFRGLASSRLFAGALGTSDDGSGGAELLALARQDFERARELDPHFRSAATELAHTYLYQPEAAEKGIAIAETELANGPSLVLAMTLMQLHASRGDREAARRVHEGTISRWLDASAEGGTTSISKAVERTDVLVAHAWGRQGRCVEARELLRAAAERSTHEDVAEELRGALGAMAECGSGSAASAALEGAGDAALAEPGNPPALRGESPRPRGPDRHLLESV